MEKDIQEKDPRSFEGDNSSEENIAPENVEAWLEAKLDWNNSSNMHNPRNWPSWKRWFTTLVVAWMSLVVTFGSSIYVSGTITMAIEFGVGRTVALLGLSLYLLGLAFGPVIAAPLSETVGRLGIYRYSLVLSLLFTLGVARAHNIGTVLVCRFFAGLFASPVLAVAGGSIQDVWRMEELSLAMATFCLAPFAGPVLGPIIGGFLIERKSWRWTMYVLMMFCGAILPLIWCLEETYKPVIIKKLAKKHGYPLPPKPEPKAALTLLFTVVLKRPFEMLFVEPIVQLLSLYMAFVFAVLFGFFEAFPFVFTTVYEFSYGDQGLTFIGIGVGLLIGTLTYIIMDARIFKPEFLKPNPPAPESRLITLKIGSILLPIGLFWLAWTSRKSVHWIVPVISGVPFGMALLLLFFTVMNYFAMCYPPMSLASAIAANNLLRYLMASAFPLFTIQMYEKLHIDWATSLYGFVCVALMPVPWFLDRYGAHLRSKSRFGYFVSSEIGDESV
ncbi:major facilitator superfamily domain-containing protein [Dipodascopsis uninucleata]